jgi:ABC-type spermidine/putrescine transport system permease subunit II
MRSNSALSARPSLGLTLATIGGVLFLHMPLALIVLYAFSSEDKSYVFPPPSLTTQWFAVALDRVDVWNAVTLSVQVALCATALALILGTLAAGALARSKFFGRDAISLLLILPIALPGVVTGIALRSAYHWATFTAGQQTTLPIWMLQELIRPRQRPVTNVVAVFIIAMTFIPIVAAYWLTQRGDDDVRR